VQADVIKKVNVEPEELAQGELTYLLDSAAASDILMISFAVFPAPGGKSAFDFRRATHPLGVKRLFLRDPNMMWYQKGTPGVGDDVPAVAEFLRKIIAQEGVKRVVMIGNSGGGFSALLFGALVGVEEIHAFNPPTRLREPDDTSAPEQLQALEAEKGKEIPYLDIRDVFRKHLKPHTKVYIHYSRGESRDKRHARYLREFPNVRLIEYPFVSHHVARFFAERAMLTPLLAAAAKGDAEAVEQTTRTMFWTALPWYPTGRIAWFFGKAFSKIKRTLANRSSDR
jgi:pimeloyl-ACP methyl ester carboxylesterase